MFSSEQIFKVSGDMGQLEAAIKFALDMYGIARNNIKYQITKDGKYCLGWGDEEEWSKYPFDFDVHIVSEIVKQHLEKQDCEDPYAWADGSSEKGFLMKVIPELFSDEYKGIKSPFYGIVSIEPHMNFYSKQAMKQEEKKLPDGLEEAAEEYRRKTCNEACKNGFLDNHPSPSIKTVFISGAKWDRAKMMEGAVEGEVYKFGEVAYVKECNNAELTKYLSQFNNGDRVKIIVIHETDIR